MKLIFSAVILWLCTLSAIAQPGWNQEPSSAEAEIYVNEPWEVTKLLERHTSFHNSLELVKGWRVQVVSGTKSSVVQDAKATLLNQFPELDIDVSYKAPIYKLKVGGKMRRIDAYKELMMIKETFPNAFLIRDDVPYRVE